MIESPSVTSAWTILPVGSVNRSFSRAPKASFRKSISFAASWTIRTGVTVRYPSGIGFTWLVMTFLLRGHEDRRGHKSLGSGGGEIAPSDESCWIRSGIEAPIGTPKYE